MAMVKYLKKKLDTTKPRYSEQILLVTWPFVISRFHCTILKISCAAGSEIRFLEVNRFFRATKDSDFLYVNA